jgi:hypothetical protein
MGSTLSENVTVRLVENSLTYKRMNSEEYDTLLIRDHVLHGPSEQDDEWSDLRRALSATVNAIVAIKSGSVASLGEL